MKKMILEADNNADILKDLLLDFVYKKPSTKELSDEVLKLQMEAASNGGNLLDLIEVA